MPLAALAIVCEGPSVKPTGNLRSPCRTTRSSVFLFFLFGCFSFSNRRENIPTRHCAKNLMTQRLLKVTRALIPRLGACARTPEWLCCRQTYQNTPRIKLSKNARDLQLIEQIQFGRVVIPNLTLPGNPGSNLTLVTEIQIQLSFRTNRGNYHG